MSFALVRSFGLSAIGVAVGKLPPGVEQVCSVLPGQLMSKSAPQTCSNSDLYCAWDMRHAMHAVSGKPISPVSTGGPCACSASAFLSKYPVDRESKKFPPKKRPCTWL